MPDRHRTRLDPRAGWALRYARAFTFSSVALVLAVAAHVSAGGLLPGLLTFVGMVGACTLLSSGWFGREATRIEIVSLLVVGQTLMHGVMTAVAGHRDDTEPSPSTVGGAISHAVEHIVSDMTPAHAPMALAHLLAAVLTGVWLARAERALWNLLRLLAQGSRDAITVMVHPPTPVLGFLPSGYPADGFFIATVLRKVLISETHVRRGPPAAPCTS